jgi:hypothetical protein
MNTPFQFRSRLAFGGEILTQQATFLPVKTVLTTGPSANYVVNLQHSAGFLPVFNFNRKNLTVAQPLLMEELR